MFLVLAQRREAAILPVLEPPIGHLLQPVPVHRTLHYPAVDLRVLVQDTVEDLEGDSNDAADPGAEGD